MFRYVDALCLLPLTMYPKQNTHTSNYMKRSFILLCFSDEFILIVTLIYCMSMTRSRNVLFPVCRANVLNSCMHYCGLAVACWTTDHYQISAWAYLKFVSYLTSLHYLWRSLGPFSLACAQKWL